MQNIKTKVSLVEFTQTGRKINKVIECLTDAKGSYQAEVTAEYSNNSPSRNKGFYVETLNPDYENAVVQCGCGTSCGETTSKNRITVNFTEYTFDFFLVSLKSVGNINGVLVNPDDSPISQATVKIEMHHQSGWGCGCGSAVADLTKTLKTDENGKFSAEVPLKYLYGSSYSITITSEIRGAKLNKSFKQVLKVGKTKYSTDEKVESIGTLRLTMSADKKDTASKDQYVCPMGCIQPVDKPGKCPKCGMNLEKKK